VDKFYLQLLVWVAVIGGIFGLLWKLGYLARLAGFVRDTKEELHRCSWPTKQELWRSTMMVLFTVAMLGAFLMVVDFVVLKFIRSLI